MLHIEKKAVKKQDTIESKEVKEPAKIDTVQEVKPVVKESQSSAKSVSKKEVVPEDKYNGLHAYAIVLKSSKSQQVFTQNAIVTARTEETATNRVQKECASYKLVSIKRIHDKQGHEIIKRVKGKAGIFFEDGTPITTKK